MGRRSRKSVIKKREKLVIEFDERKRAEFLTGFKRRKDERRRKAKEEIQQIIKAEKKRIRKKKSVQYAAQMRELGPELSSSNRKMYDLPTHTVTVTEINNIDLTNADGTYLGVNMGSSERESAITADRYHSKSVDSISGKRTDSEVKPRKKRQGSRHLSFTHTLRSKRRKLDPAERRKLKQKQNKKC